MRRYGDDSSASLVRPNRVPLTRLLEHTGPRSYPPYPFARVPFRPPRPTARRRLPEESTLSHDTPSAPPQAPRTGRPRDGAASGLARFNSLSRARAETALLACCGSRRWAHRLAHHRPYPDLRALLAAADEASYDLTPADLGEALAREPAPGLPHPPPPRPLAAHTALRAAHAAYESRFGHVFVICLDAVEPGERLAHVLAGIRTRLGNDPEEERAVTAEELRRAANGRLARLVTFSPSPSVPL